MRSSPLKMLLTVEEQEIAMKKVWTHQKRNPTEAFKCMLKMGIRQIVRTRIIEFGTPELRGVYP